MTSREAQARTIQMAIRDILLRDWDPIGVADVPEAQDEYDGYVEPVYGLLAQGSSANEIATYLATVQRDAMEIAGSAKDSMEVAARLKRIDIAVRPA
jgi:hypothetical protein